MRKATGNYRTYSIPGKTAALVADFEVEDLPSAELEPRFYACSVGPALGQNTPIIVNIVYAYVKFENRSKQNANLIVPLFSDINFLINFNM